MLSIFAALLLAGASARGQTPEPVARLTLTVGKALMVDSPVKIRRVASANGDLVEIIVVAPKEVLINGKLPGETSLVIWLENDTRLTYDLCVRPSSERLDVVREQIARESPGTGVDVSFDNGTAFVRGKVKNVVTGDRVMAIAATLGKTVNLLRVEVPPGEPQILLRVKFANVDRTASIDLGVDLASTAFNQTTVLGTGSPISLTGGSPFSLAQAVNVFLFRRDLNLAAAIHALEVKRQLQLLAEPNLMVINNTAASFVAGGEFPFPSVQSGAGSSAVTISFKEYGIKLGFLPVVTPRGTIRLQVSPEVSALDYTNSVTIAGTTVPGTSTRRVQTEVELESGQSFVIAGLLDSQTTESLSKIPGIGDIPLLGKLFQSKTLSRSNSELLVIVTPEIVQPVSDNSLLPDLKFSTPFLRPSSGVPPWQPAPAARPGPTFSDGIPMEQLTRPQKVKAEAATFPGPATLR